MSDYSAFHPDLAAALVALEAKADQKSVAPKPVSLGPLETAVSDLQSRVKALEVGVAKVAEDLKPKVVALDVNSSATPSVK